MAGCSYYNDRTEFDRILLDSGADIHTASSSTPGAPLVCAIQNNNHANIRLILDRGARIDLYSDDENQGTLHLAADRGDLETIGIIASASKNGLGNLDTEAKDMYNHIPLQVFDTTRHQTRGEDEETYQECRRAFINLLDPVNSHTHVGDAESTRPRIEEISSNEENILYDCEDSSTAATLVSMEAI